MPALLSMVSLVKMAAFGPAATRSWVAALTEAGAAASTPTSKRAIPAAGGVVLVAIVALPSIMIDAMDGLE